FDDKALTVLENAVDLHLDSAVIAVAYVGRDLKPAVRQSLLLDAITCDGFLRAFVEQHELRAVFDVIYGGVDRAICASVMGGGGAGCEEQCRARCKGQN